jgi:hypothetical protein
MHYGNFFECEFQRLKLKYLKDDSVPESYEWIKYLYPLQNSQTEFQRLKLKYLKDDSVPESCDWILDSPVTVC